MTNIRQIVRSVLSPADRRGHGVRGLLAAVVLLAAGLQACTVLTSELPEALEADGRAPGGVHYFLPKTVIDLTLSVQPETASFRLRAENRRSIADPHQRFYIRYRPLPQYDDYFSITLSPHGYLKRVHADTTDKTNEIIVNLAKAFGALGGGLESAVVQPNEAQLARLTVDPASAADLETASAKFDAAVTAYAKAAKTSVCKLDKATGIILDVAKHAQCEEYTAILAGLAAGKPFVAVRSEQLADRHAHGGHASAGRKLARAAHHRHDASAVAAPDTVEESGSPRAADCSVGICYRPPEPLQLSMTVGKSQSKEILLVPNLARLVEIDIRRAFLVNKIQTIEFDPEEGTLSKLYVKKNSELLALSTLPVAVLTAIADGLSLRITVINNKTSEAKASKELLEARADLEKQRALYEASARVASNAGTVSQSSVPRLATPTDTGRQSGTFLGNEKPLN